MSYAQGKDWALIQADCLRALAVFPENRFDSCVTDPPYELGFMGKKWDASGIAFSVDLWRAVLRVLKPGAHLLAFGGTRTAHRMACAIEDAGFEIRDDLHWFYGTGFPKSKTAASGMPEGQGTALKPAHEPVYLARKPLVGTLEKNIAAFGTGGLQIDACRIGTDIVGGGGAFGSSWKEGSGLSKGYEARPVSGRWPANVLLDEHAAAELDAQSGETKSTTGQKNAKRSNSVATGKPNQDDRVVGHSDSGGASRFFYVAKPSRKERDAGCDHIPARSGGEATDREDESAGVQNPRAGAGRTGGARNFHPTVKPVELMRYLVRLVTPVDGTVLDPFCGSGTTGIAARLEARGFLGIEREPDYFTIAEARIRGAA